MQASYISDDFKYAYPYPQPYAEDFGVIRFDNKYPNVRSDMFFKPQKVTTLE